jgi:hypothetical protein
MLSLARAEDQAMSQQTREAHWVIVEPGVIALPTTGYVIRYEGRFFNLCHKGNSLGVFTILADAQQTAVGHMRDMITVGLDP